MSVPIAPHLPHEGKRSASLTCLQKLQIVLLPRITHNDGSARLIHRFPAPTGRLALAPGTAWGKRPPMNRALSGRYKAL